MDLSKELAAARARIAQHKSDMAEDEERGELSPLKEAAYLRAITLEEDRVVLIRSL